MPNIATVYPALFDAEELAQKRAEQQAELSIERLKLFASLHNSKLKKEEASNSNE